MRSDPRSRRTVELRYGDRAIRSVEGDSVAAALIDAGVQVFRETRFGDRRGVFCGMGVCHECVVSIDGVPGRRACVTPVRDGMQIEVGAPAPVLDGEAPPVLAEVELAPDVLVVGAGPAGLAAAVAAAEAGAEVLLLDERPKLGGQYFKQPSDGLALDESALDSQYRAGRELTARVRALGVHVLGATQVWAAFGRDEILAADVATSYTLRPRRLVLATGAYERGVPLPGWTLPGFTTTGAAQTLLRSYAVTPGQRVLVSGNGPLNVQVAAELVRAGATVVALAELAHPASPAHALELARMLGAAPGLVRAGLGYTRTLGRARVPLLYRSAVVRADGDGVVECATVARIDANGRAVPGTERTFEVDAVCAGFGFLPSNEIARALGVNHRFDLERGHLVANADRNGRSSVDAVWVVGDGGGVAGARVAQAIGFLAGIDAARSLGQALPAPLADEARRARRAQARAERFQRALARLYAAPRLLDQLAQGDTLVCRCENVPLRALEEAWAGGVHASGSVKRVSRAGMGSCQGRYCGALVAELGARHAGTALDEHGGFAPTPPFKPIAIGSVAGRD